MIRTTQHGRPRLSAPLITPEHFRAEPSLPVWGKRTSIFPSTMMNISLPSPAFPVGAEIPSCGELSVMPHSFA